MEKLFKLSLFALSLQSCVAYYKTAVPIEEAVNGKNVKIIHENGTVMKFNYLELHRDSLFYGYKPNINTNVMEATQITKPYDLYKVYRKNQTGSIGLSLLAAYFFVGIPIAVIGLSMDCENGGFFCGFLNLH